MKKSSKNIWNRNYIFYYINTHNIWASNYYIMDRIIKEIPLLGLFWGILLLLLLVLNDVIFLTSL